MTDQVIKNIIIRYLSNEANTEELIKLSDWISIDSNDKIFEEFVKLHYETITALNRPDVDIIKRNLLKEIKKDANNVKQKPYLRRVGVVLRYAAIGLLFFVLGDLNQNEYFDESLKDILHLAEEQTITIEMSNGNIKTIDTKKDQQIEDSNGNIIGIQKGTKLTYLSNTPTDKLSYNTLRVPYGRRFDVVLSDGTQVFLNSGSSLKYPIKFLEGSNRIVYLTGEAYFEVTKDKEHSFIVNTDDIDIKVLGTKFNVSHYPEDSITNTVLVEGSVELYELDMHGKEIIKPVLLEPNFKAEWNKTERKMSVENVDTWIYTSWIQGKLVFRNTAFREIRKGLERKYNVIINCQNPDLDNQLFDATFDIETINQVMESFNKSYAIDYDIVDNKIIIN